MVICCAAVNCSNRQGKVDKSAISFHRFPLSDSKRLIQWLRAVRRDNWVPSRYSFLCSEHFTKDCFAKRQKDQNRLLKPTAVPSIFHFKEERMAGRGHAKAKRKVAVKLSEEECEKDHLTVDRSTSTACEKTTKIKEENVAQSTCESRCNLNFDPKETNVHLQCGTSLVAPFDSSVTLSSHREQRQSVESSTQTNVHIGSWAADSSGISVDDFTPSASGACKFIGSLHSYSFSSKHAREKPSFPREALERKKMKKDTDPFDFNREGSDKSFIESGVPLSCTSTLLQSSESAASVPAFISLGSPAEAAVEAVSQAVHIPNDHIPISDVLTSASGACRLIDSLHSYCFSSKQTKNQVCFLKEQVDKKNAELKLLRQKLTRSDNQVKKMKIKLAELKKREIAAFGLPSPDFG
ncbi:peroxynitrite isomerase THAP4-like [Protopterus annectens]|uniref:peroxynitrite isomerase THAP4-like n=1 Tax=Protopterus annectens TaxID=7888 RepID=UPI001CFB5319|nr:peroxynitrite isomerase THAP4-like [Protopterus annectens]